MATNQNSELKAQSLLEEGNKAYSLSDYETSVEKFGEACQILDSIYGSLSEKNGIAYFLYGRALLDYAIKCNTVLGQSEKSTSHEITSKVSQEGAKSARFHFEGDMENEPGERSKYDDSDDGSEGDDEQDQNLDDNFETAWDVLDVARVILEKCEGKEMRLKLADVHLCLGDLSLEIEKFGEAVLEFGKALAILKDELTDDNRLLAEAHYKLALALEFSPTKAEQAGPEIEKAIQVLNNRIERLQSRCEGKGKGKAAEVPISEDAAKEIEEMKQIIPDMKEKLEELKMRQITEAKAKELLSQMLKKNTSSDTSALLQSATINDLSSMVKRKSRPDTQGNQNADIKDNKKQKTDDS